MMSELPQEEMARLGRAWRKMGLYEHASVAAFARLVLQLLGLGAPPWLLKQAIRAMDDEVEHARLCFGIARRLTGEFAGPGSLDLSRAIIDHGDPRAILEAAIVEGCFEETVSARCAAIARDRAEEPGIRAAMVRIAEDEARHADLSWRLVEWMIDTHPDLRSIAEACFVRALAAAHCQPAEVPVEERETPHPPCDEKYGQLLADSTRQVRESTLHDHIIPRAAALFGWRNTAEPSESADVHKRTTR